MDSSIAIVKGPAFNSILWPGHWSLQVLVWWAAVSVIAHLIALLAYCLLGTYMWYNEVKFSSIQLQLIILTAMLIIFIKCLGQETTKLTI